MSNYGGSSYPQTAPPAHGGAPADAAVPKAFPIVAIVGAVLVLACTWVNWVVGEAGGETGGVKGKDGDGVITLIVSIVAALALIGAMVTKKALLYLGGAVLSLVTVVFAVINMVDPARLVAAKLESEGASSAEAEKYAEQVVKAADFSAGPGLYMVLIGALLTVVFGVLGFMKSRNSR
ncbi:Trp biosynthesis-associated membrane protein [Streptomyces sp. FXJ1.4098]|uniref:Trp biosynthesis-associated membrane protein n=1 Tax=Streptomyces sp. NPDC020845 TaxID=3365096 RepID=UPI00299802CA|nr:Trp biosynthesis-associated membrane protein [Streptomyces sp. FXJ1.4098]